MRVLLLWRVAGGVYMYGLLINLLEGRWAESCLFLLLWIMAGLKSGALRW